MSLFTTCIVVEFSKYTHIMMQYIMFVCDKLHLDKQSEGSADVTTPSDALCIHLVRQQRCLSRQNIPDKQNKFG